MQSIGTVRYRSLPIRMTKVKYNNSTCWQEGRETESLVHCWWEWKVVLLLWKIIWLLLTHLPMQLAYNPAIDFGQSQRNENLYSHKNANGCFNNSQELETTHMPFNRWMVRQTVVWPYHSTRPSDQMHTLGGRGWIAGELHWVKKLILEDYILYDSVYTIFLIW